MVGIVSYGLYIPKNRITTDEIASHWGKDPSVIKSALNVNEKAVGGYDEDSLTMAYESSLSAFDKAPVKPSELEAVFVGSENHPYAVNPTSTALAEYLGVGNNYTGYDTQFACKAATGALFSSFGFVKSGLIKHALVVGTDKATGRPGDPLEYSAGSAAASFVVGTQNVLLEFVAGVSYSSDTPDFWRRENSPYPSHAGRFTAGPGYFKHIVEATKLILERQKAKPSDFDHAIFHTPNGSFPAKAAHMLGFSKEQTQHARVVTELGNSYTASAFIALCSVMEFAQAGERILFVSYGSGAGSDAFVFTVTKELDKRRKKLSNMMTNKRYVNYASYTRHMNVNH